MRFQWCILLILPLAIATNDDLMRYKKFYADELNFFKENYCRSFATSLGASRPSGPCRNQQFSVLEKLILSNNANPDSSIAMRLYPESLYNKEEFAHRRLGFIPQNLEGNLYIPKSPSKRASDEYLNYADLGYVTPVKDQRDCGSCYTFTAMSVLESAILRRYGVTKDLSVQQGLDCTYSRYDDMNYGCLGGHPFYVLQHSTRFQIVEDSQYRYKSRLGTCDMAERKQTLNVTAVVVSLDDSDDALKQVLRELGPVSVAIAVGESSFKHYAGGIITDCGTQLDHAVVLVGYKDTAEESYWIIKNSWGTKWGENGFARIKMGSSCNIKLDNPVGVLLDAV